MPFSFNLARRRVFYPQDENLNGEIEVERAEEEEVEEESTRRCHVA